MALLRADSQPSTRLRIFALALSLPLLAVAAGGANTPTVQPRFQLLWLNGKPVCPTGSKLATNANGKPMCVALQTAAPQH